MRVFVIAGEPSGDALGGAVMAGLRQLRPDVSFDGVGGPLMQAQGLVSRFPMDELSVMGLAEVLPKYRGLKRRIAECAQAVLDTRPDVLLTIDSPDFCLRVAKLVKAGSEITTVHYVAPSVWAWRPKRADRMAHHVDHVLALLPFEPPYMTAAGMGCDFVGHPVVAQPQASQTEAEAFRMQYRNGAGPLVLALPGSRKGEVTRLTARFGAALGQLHDSHPDLSVVIPCAASVVGLVRDLTAHWPVTPVLIDPADDPDGAVKRAAFRAADVALAASGTVSLELAAAGTPMVIAYDMAWLSRVIMQRMVRIDTVTLVNLVSDTRAVPEYIAADCTADKISAGLRDTLAAPGAQQIAMDLTMDRLGRGGEAPGLRAARALIAVAENT
ncbi:lipid-A-disaccharide synthase [Loktanella sp. 3ANDIMAR09]|uniref:lipid-A-disaccharide synthase n=1 Tax=Loktanella sp. 3ANDIMAR09 TaxID=1225657 RepID=UPI0006F7BA3B|nr:lipid-A-disaccharide synthase [Loktanella sp. 3ANDIMAR09]KQI69609.1 lipid-A-disaccharide synthase [Loktanella sp. 3ANDIMAR09]